MPKWILFALLPILAALLVFGPAMLLGGDKPSNSETSKTNTAPSESVFRRSSPERTSESTRRSADSLPSGWTVGASMLFVLAIAFGGFWVVRRVQNGNLGTAGPRNIDIKESRRLGKGRALHYVRVVDTLLLVAESESGITLLRDMTPADAQDPGVDTYDEEEGATPRDLLPTPPRRQASAKLGNFRELLGKLG